MTLPEHFTPIARRIFDESTRLHRWVETQPWLTLGDAHRLLERGLLVMAHRHVGTEVELVVKRSRSKAA
jgi:hypothetical protein